MQSVHPTASLQGKSDLAMIRSASKWYLGIIMCQAHDTHIHQCQHNPNPNFPSLNWLISYTKYMQVLEPYFNNMDPCYSYLRNQARTILQQEDNLSEIVQLVGKESLSEDQKVIMEVAKLIREDFLQQNAFTDYDFTCPLPKTVGMLSVIINFYDLCQKAIADSPSDAKLTYAHIKTSLAPIIQKVIDSKFIDPKMATADITREYNNINDESPNIQHF